MSLPIDKLEKIKKRYEDICDQLAKPETMADQKRFQNLSIEQSELQDIYEHFVKWLKIAEELSDAKVLVEQESDADMRDMAEEEIDNLKTKQQQLESTLKELLAPKDMNEGKNVFVEIRAGAGGDEASLFAAVLYRMYSRFAERNGWPSEIVSSSETGLGGYKEIIMFIKSKQVYHHLRYESGVHRVQRVPTTETQGRIHTSTVTVAVLPEVDDVEVDIKDDELRIDVFRSSGPGGQSVNTTDSAVRITHIPTGVVVSCQDEKSQHKNKAKAMKILRARILDAEQQKQRDSIAASRKSQVGTGDRSERIRTYNYPQSRVTDHRIGLTLHKLDVILDGELLHLTEPLNLEMKNLELNAEQDN